MTRIYLDHSATTPLDPRVLDQMLPFFSEQFGNSKAVHRLGSEAEYAIEIARESVARWLNCQPDEVIFTSGGTESDNLALRGPAQAAATQGRPFNVITSAVEHAAVGGTAHQLAATQAAGVCVLPVDSHGRVAPDDLRAALRHLPAHSITVVSLIHANNEIGTHTSVEQYAAIAHDHGALFHTDAVQSPGYFPLDVAALDADMLALSSHKFYGPKGAGVFYLREGTPFLTSQTGAPHEHGRRAGTHNTPGIVGTAAALDLVCQSREREAARLRDLRDRLVDAILKLVEGVRFIGDPVDRLPGHASLAFRDVQSSTLLMLLDQAGIAASSGSACKVGSEQPSAILLALGYGPEWTRGGLRLSLGHLTTEADIDAVIDVLPGAVEKARALGAAG